MSVKNISLLSLVTFSLIACGKDGSGKNQFETGKNLGTQKKLISPIEKPTPSDSSTSSHLGFYPINDASVPSAVQAAAASVYMIVTPAGDQTTVAGIFGEGHTLNEIIEKVQAKPVSIELSQGDKDVYLYQLNLCAKEADPLHCKMFEGNLQSTAYVVGDGRRLRTAFHAVRVAALSGALSYHGTESVNICIFVYDASGTLIYSPSSGKAIAKFPTENLANLQKTFSLPNEDLAEIQLDKIIGKPIVPAAAPKFGEAIYTIGFPQPSKDRSPLGAPDSPGQQLRVTIGKVISLKTTYEKHGITGEITEATKTAFGSMIVTDSDGAPGLSGGASVNANGQVVGTFTAGNPADGHATTEHVSYSSADSLLSAPFTH